MFNTIILVVQLLQTNPEMFKRAEARPFQNVPLEQVATEFEKDKEDEDVLVAFQDQEHEAFRYELKARFESASADDQQRILKALSK